MKKLRLTLMLGSGALLFALIVLVACGGMSPHHYDARMAAPRHAKRVAPAPEQRPANTEQYTDYGVRPFVDTSEDKLSTFAIDVDTGSYTIARRKLREERLPPKESVRVEEFVNYFKYDYAQPDSGPFAIHMEAAKSPFTDNPKRRLFRVALQGFRPPADQRKPVHLTFLIDVSGSMNSADKLGLAKRSLQLLTKNLRQGDTVAVATYAGRVARILEPTGMDQRSKIIDAIEELQSGGSTAMSSGMELAYEMATASHQKGHVSRVIVVSDGDANVGHTSHEEILETIDGYVKQGIRMSTIGVGMGNYKDTMMEQLSNKGNGNYYYIDTFTEAKRIFGEQLDGTLEVIAKDVKIQVEFNPESVARYRLIGYENRKVEDEDFRNDKVDGGELGAGHTVTALYELELTDAPQGQIANVRLRHKEPEEAESSETEKMFGSRNINTEFANTSPDFRFAVAVAAFAEVLRESPHAKDVSLDKVVEIAKSATGSQKDRVEFVQLVRTAQNLRKN